VERVQLRQPYLRLYVIPPVVLSARPQSRFDLLPSNPVLTIASR
jgi:hypothetical protein